MFMRRSGQDEDFGSNGSAALNAGAFTTGRRSRGGLPPPVKPRVQVRMIDASSVHEMSEKNQEIRNGE